MIRLIDKTPPVLSGSAEQDIRALYEYIAYLQEHLNFILTNIGREGMNNG